MKNAGVLLSSPLASSGFQLLIGMSQSEIDGSDCRAKFFISDLYWLADGLGHMSVLISGSHPFTFLCLSSLLGADVCLPVLNDDNPKCFNRNVLITGGASYLRPLVPFLTVAGQIERVRASLPLAPFVKMPFSIRRLVCNLIIWDKARVNSLLVEFSSNTKLDKTEVRAFMRTQVLIQKSFLIL